MPKVCPIAASSSNAVISKFCIGMKCAWYCEFARDCSIHLLAGMFADSEICRSCMAHTKIFITVVKQDPRTLEIVAIKDGGKDAVESWNRRTHDES